MSTSAKQFYGDPAETTNGRRPCHYCGLHHETLCPRIVEVEYHPDGTVKRVVLRGPEFIRG